MAARLGSETTKIHLHLFTEDLQKFDELLCRQGIRTVGRSKAIRMVFRSYVKYLESRINAKPVPFDASINDIIGIEPADGSDK